MKDGEKRPHKGLSLRAKNTLIFIALFALLIAALWLINRFYLQKYYLNKQLNCLEETRLLLEELVADTDNETLRISLNRQCEKSGIAATLTKKDSFGGPVLLYIFGDGHGPLRIWEPERPGYVMDEAGQEPVTVYQKTDHYTICQKKDPMTQTMKIECRGILEAEGEEHRYLLSLPMARIEESAAISNQFLLIMGLGILMLGGLLVFYITRHLTAPIEVLNRLSRKMADLDFSQRYEGHSGDEIQTLGENINHLSDTLAVTIDDLKKANLALEADVLEKEQENLRRKELLSNISHELKTPIALIQGYAEGLREGLCEEEETRIRYSEIIMEESGRMNRLVHLLLDLDEMESGQIQVQKNAFDLAALIRDVTQAYQSRQDGSGALWELDLPDKLPVESDEFLVEQILQNYLSNAVHHAREGGIIRVSAQPEEGGACIRVYNEGNAIPEEALDQIWNKFYKVDKARTRSYGGSGIGLSLVKASTELLGGSCGVCNLPGGVEFTARI